MSNPYLENFKTLIKSQTNSLSMADWICNHTTLRGRPFSFEGHEFQRQILNDMHPNLYVKKLSQVGLTEGQIRKGLGFLKQNIGTGLLYTFPDLKMRDKNSKTRIRPIVDKDFPTTKGLNETRTNDIIQLDQSFMYITANTESDATSTPVDMIINDELDLADQEFLALVNSRIQHSRYKIKQNFSTPTFTGYGVSAGFESSDQHEYFYRCPHCGHQQIPTYDRESVMLPGLPDYIEDYRKEIDEKLAISLNLDSAYVKCKKCHKKLDLTDESLREWVPKYPSRLHCRGYQVRPFSSNLLSIKYIVMTMADFIKKGQIRRGINTVLGEEYEDKSSRLNESDIRECFKNPKIPDLSKDKPCTIGIDSGLICHITISCEEGTVLFKQVHSDYLKTEVKNLFSQYNIVAGAMDRYPQITLANEIRDQTNGVIQPVVYEGIKDVDVVMDVDDTKLYYKINRTATLDAVMNNINGKKAQFFGYGNMESIIVEHLKDMVRMDEPEKPPTWKKLNGNDHFFHSLAYSYVARKIKYLDEYGDRSDQRICVDLAGPSDYNETNNLKLGLVGYGQETNNNRIISRWR